MIKTIHPYKKKFWTFYDPETGRTEAENALVAGIDTMLNTLREKLGDFSLQFSDIPLQDEDFRLSWLRHDHTGNYYKNNKTGVEGWLCPVLYDYFPVAPKTIYVKVVL